MGTILSDLKELWEAIKLFPQYLGDQWKKFKKNWNHPSLIDRWFFRGKTIGYIAMEILLAVVTAGAGTALKATSKFGKVAKVLSGIGKKFNPLKKMADKLSGSKYVKKLKQKVKKSKKKEKVEAKKDKDLDEKLESELLKRQKKYKKAAKALDDDGGHSYADHGAHVTEKQHFVRLTEGKTPGGRIDEELQKISSSFSTNKVHGDSYDRVLKEFHEHVFKKRKGKIKEPRQLKKRIEVDIIMEGGGFEYTLGKGKKLIKTKTDFVRAVFKLVDEPTQKYKLVTMFPTNILK